MRRRLALLLGAVLAATSVALIPSGAQAVVRDGGPLAADQTVTTTFAAGSDATTYSLTVPAGARPTLTFTPATTPNEVSARLTYADGSSGGGGGYFTAEPDTAFVEFAPHGDRATGHAATLRIAGAVSGSATFSVHYVVDTEVAVTPGTPTPLTFGDLGQQARLTFDAAAGDGVMVTLAADDLSAPTPRDGFGRLNLRLLPEGFGFLEFTPGVYSTETVLTDGPHTLVVDPAFDLTGSITVRVSLVPAGSTPLSYGAGPTSATLGAADTAPLFTFVTRGGAATVIQAVGPSLTHADGSRGTASLVLDVPGAAPVTLGTVSDRTVAFTTSAPLDPGALARLRLVGDGDTTGALGLRVYLDPGPATAVPIGATTPITVPTDSATGRFSFEAGAGDQIELYLRDLSFTVPDLVAFAGIRIEDEIGGVYWDSQLFPANGSATFVAPSAGTYTLALTVDRSAGLTGSLLAVRTSTVIRDVATGFDEVVTIGEPGQNIELVVPGTTGETLLVTASDVSLGADEGVTVTLTRPDGFSPGGPALFAGGTVFLESGASEQAGVWRVGLDGLGTTTGDVRVHVYAPPLVTGVLGAVDRPTTVAVPEPGGLARYTFDARAGDPLILDVADVTQTAGGDFQFFGVTVLRPDGSFFSAGSARPGEQTWIEPADVLDADGTWTVVVDPSNSMTGSLTITRRAARVLTSAITPGTATTATFDRAGDVRRLTFTAKAGQRPVLSISDRTVFTRMRLIGPGGLVTADIASFDVSDYFELPDVTTPGTWTLELDPFERETGSVGVLLDLVTDPARTVRTGVTTTVPFTAGQNPRLRVDIERGAHIAVDVRALTPLGADMRVNFVRPDGSVAESNAFNESGQWVEMTEVADVAGRWTVQIDPAGRTAGTTSLRLYSAKDTVVTGRIGKTTKIDVKAVTQDVALPFTGVPTGAEVQFVSWKLSESTIASTYIWLVDPNGNPGGVMLAGPGTTTGVFQVDPQMSGPWRLVVDPRDGGTGSARIFFVIGDLF
ncbi:hypothetical protein [Kineosporia sp. R_H_3]|uniref:hypothetical protein n=1 Tax=Kineosporia sp. R_H_3 TaxID=1961848 RepID=UPI000B4A5A6B|nr:hypothetical protein [Kineosporia sp. R_H_3]